MSMETNEQETRKKIKEENERETNLLLNRIESWWTNKAKRELKTSTSDQEEVDKIINKVEHEITNLTNEFKKKIENVLAWQERVDEWREKKKP